MTAHPETIQERVSSPTAQRRPRPRFSRDCSRYVGFSTIGPGNGTGTLQFPVSPSFSQNLGLRPRCAPSFLSAILASAITILCFSAPPLRACGWPPPPREALLTRHGLVYSHPNTHPP